jgi:hypothetical protein
VIGPHNQVLSIIHLYIFLIVYHIKTVFAFMPGKIYIPDLTLLAYE